MYFSINEWVFYCSNEWLNKIFISIFFFLWVFIDFIMLYYFNWLGKFFLGRVLVRVLWNKLGCELIILKNINIIERGFCWGYVSKIYFFME